MARRWLSQLMHVLALEGAQFCCWVDPARSGPAMRGFTQCRRARHRSQAAPTRCATFAPHRVLRRGRHGGSLAMNIALALGRRTVVLFGPRAIRRSEAIWAGRRSFRT